MDYFGWLTGLVFFGWLTGRCIFGWLAGARDFWMVDQIKFVKISTTLERQLDFQGLLL